MGGTFNPIHIGHLVTAEEARSQFQLDKVLFIPTGSPPHKDVGDHVSPEHRYLMTVLATAANPFFEVSRLEVDHVTTSYTVDTLLALREIYGEDVSFYFITGADAILEIITWKEPSRLAGLCSFIAATRPGYSLSRFDRIIAEAKAKYGDEYPDVRLMQIPALAISSTDIRARVKESRPIRYIVPESVAAYVEKVGLYTGAPAASLGGSS